VPVRSARLRAGDALGTILASSVVSDTPVPFYAIALREGLAVKAFDIVGASAQSPMLLSGSPARVLVGDPGRTYLPPGRLRAVASYAVPVWAGLEDEEVKQTTVWEPA